MVHSKVAQQRTIDLSGSITVTPMANADGKGKSLKPDIPSLYSCLSASVSGFKKRPISGFVVPYQSPAKIRFSFEILL